MSTCPECGKKTRSWLTNDVIHQRFKFVAAAEFIGSILDDVILFEWEPAIGSKFIMNPLAEFFHILIKLIFISELIKPRYCLVEIPIHDKGCTLNNIEWNNFCFLVREVVK